MASNYQCRSCGGTSNYDPKSGHLKCTYCGNEEEILNEKRDVSHPLEEYQALVDKLTPQENAAAHEGHTVMECKNCGACIEWDDVSTAQICPYCASSIVLMERQEEQLMPDGVIPFAVDKEEVQSIFRKWLEGKWLAPGSLKRLAERGSIQSVYIPYWCFDANVSANYEAEGGKNYTRYVTNAKGEKEAVVETVWYDVDGYIERDYDDVVIIGSQSLDRVLAQDIKRFATSSSYPYDERYLAGFNAERYSVDMPVAHVEAQDVMRDWLEESIANAVRSNYDEVRNIRFDPVYNNEQYKQLLLPVYATAYQFKNNVYQVLINGETGQISGEYPKSYIKIALIVMAILFIIYVLYPWIEPILKK